MKNNRKSHSVIIVIGWLLIACLFSSCESSPNIRNSVLTPTSLEASITPTPTTIWFPPTNTPPPIIPTPTDVSNPESLMVGELILEDNFTKADMWVTEYDQQGSISFSNQEVIMVVNDPNTFFSFIRKEPTLDNFILNIDMDVRLCKHKDEFGILFRYMNSFNYYRLVFTCEGYVELDRIYKGVPQTIQLPVMNWISPPNQLSTNNVTISTDGKSIGVYINNVVLFTIQDQYLDHGMIGFFGSTTGETPITIAFSNLTIHKISKHP